MGVGRRYSRSPIFCCIYDCPFSLIFHICLYFGIFLLRLKYSINERVRDKTKYMG